MSLKDDLLFTANRIKNEVDENDNTANRVGSHLVFQIEASFELFDSASVDLANVSQSLDNSKLNITEFNQYTSSVVSDIDDKVDQSEYDTDSGSFDSRIDLKADSSELDSLSGSVSNDLDDKVDVSVYETFSGSVDTNLGSLETDKLEISTYETDSGSFDTRIDDKASQSSLDNVSSSLASDKLNVSDYETDSGSFDTRIESVSGSVYTDSGSFDSRIELKADSTDLTSVSSSLFSHENDDTIHFTQGEISITESQISDLDKYTQTQVDNLLDDKLDVSSYETDSGSFDSRIDSKVDQTEYDTFSGSVDTEIDSKIEDAPSDGNLYARRDSQWESFTTGSGGGGSTTEWGDITGSIDDQNDLSGSLAGLQQNIDDGVDTAQRYVQIESSPGPFQTFELSESNAGKTLMRTPSGYPQTLTIPEGLSIQGSLTTIISQQAGQLTISAENGNVFIRAEGGSGGSGAEFTVDENLYKEVKILSLGGDSYVIIGDVTEVV